MVHPGRNVVFVFIVLYEMLCGMYVFENILLFHIQCYSHRGKVLLPLQQ